ncbi:lipoyl protein ligase domain-containing protein [Leptolyngbya iicbica]|uniref:lipoyl protein ligase domain-containing protein n=1 Tax=Leptolyngbya iicbica TaxID=3161580 RepID=UPI001F5E0D7A|nr:biotin/lipoate A/B protein ligase family protein [Leptolyngbya sp. LK]
MNTGAAQMALDSWMLDQIVTEDRAPILRFYRWSAITISLGYHQRQWPEHWSNLTWQKQPIELVRRPTGGRAVLHQGDLTYAIAMPLVGSRQTAYQLICDALIAAWRQFGVTLHYGTAGSGYRHQANCFALATQADLVTSEGYKLIGSAQLRRDRYVLQHGSMRLWPQFDLAKQVFGCLSAAEPEPPTAIPSKPDDEFVKQLQGAIQQELTQRLQVDFSSKPLSDQELATIAERSPKFAIPANSSPALAASTPADIPPRL